MDRRGFIKSIAALSALALAPDVVAADVTGGKEFVGVTFRFTRPMVIGVSSVRFERCRFIFDFPLRPGESLITVGRRVRNVVISNCVIEMNSGVVPAGVTSISVG